jgi:hypothetical protein
MRKREENLWIIVLAGCLLMTPTAIDSVQTGIAGIASSHLLNRPTTSFWIGMTACVGGTLAFYVWLGVLVRDALRAKKRLVERL